MHCETVTLIGWNHCQREGNMTIFSVQDLPKGGNMARNVYGMYVLGGIY